VSRNKLFLYIGLVLLFIAFFFKWTGIWITSFGILLGIAIVFKVLFLLMTFREKGFKFQLWIYLMMAGVGLILLSMLFKTVIPVQLVHKVLFYSAILLKITGLVLMLFSQKRKLKK